MRASTAPLALFSLLGLAAAVPTPVELAPRCGSTVYPFLMQQLNEANPSSLGSPNTGPNGAFKVSQTVTSGAVVSDRIHQLVAFENIPAGAYGCQLNVAFPAAYPLATTGPATPTLNVTTLYKDAPSSITNPNLYSWDYFYPPASPPLGQGLFGSVALAPGISAAINSESCRGPDRPDDLGRLAFVFSLASWVSTSASVGYDQHSAAPVAGVYLTYNC